LPAAIQLEPQLTAAYMNSALHFCTRDRLEAAALAARAALEIDPNLPGAQQSGNAQLALGEVEAAIAASIERSRFAPDQTEAHSNIPLHTPLPPDLRSRGAPHTQARAWGARFGEPLRAEQPPHTNSPDLAGGFGSGTSRATCSTTRWGFFSKRSFANHDSATVEVFSIRMHATRMYVTQRLPGGPDHWRNITGLDVSSRGRLIRRDGHRYPRGPVRAHS